MAYQRAVHEHAAMERDRVARLESARAEHQRVAAEIEHNEGASKGILVTTSGFGKASFEFAKDKPLELLSGSNLLYLLKVHAEVDAKIEPPEHWVEPEADTGPARWHDPQDAATWT